MQLLGWPVGTTPLSACRPPAPLLDVRIGFGFGGALKCSLSDAQLGVRDGYCGGRYFLLTVFFTVPLTKPFLASMGECESSSSTHTTRRKAVACGGWHPALLLGIAYSASIGGVATIIGTPKRDFSWHVGTTGRN